ncbi:hypothetical protein BDQ17DRAFT_1488421 [Cyathus striatus]|nr:hypothetical protein BDQ17DRAFT_1488421 [Cyathus striatus]
MAKDKDQSRNRVAAKSRPTVEAKRGRSPSPAVESESRLDSVISGNNTASPFAVVDLPGKGKGLVATRNIEQGELLIQEKPLFVVPRQITTSPTTLIAQLVSSLNITEQESFYGLSYVNFPEHLDPKKHPAEVALVIFQTNAVSAGPEGVGIFPRMARLNHGCSSSFNAVYSWRKKEQELFVYALKSIPKGEELLTSYLDTKKPRHERRAYLLEHYGFKCMCRTCSLPEKASRASDARLSAISEAYRRFSEWGNHKIGGRDAVDLVRKIWQLEDEEGYWSERGRLAADAAWVAASHGDESATMKWAQLAVKWYTYEIGGDTEEVAEMQRVLSHPEVHPTWGTRERTVVGAAEEP